jgi:L-fucose isomerase
MNETVWKMNGFPKVGIRPIIDGRRRGVRESLEVQTMNMAKTAAKLISDNLRYPDGSKVECVIADTTIGGVYEAEKCAKKFRESGVGVSLSVTPCWCYGTETMDADPQIPKAVWGFNGTERPGAVYLAAMLSGYAQRGMPTYGIYGREVQDAKDTSVPADVKEKILRFVKAGLAVAMMKGKSYLSVGTSSMGIAGSFLNVDFFQDYLGMRPENMDECEIERRVKEGIYDKEEYKKALAWAKKYC